MQEKVLIWEDEILLPTYGVGKPEKNPLFLEKRVYQGSSGVVYPYPVIEKIKDECEQKAYQAVFLENKYLKIMILPELGGRIQMAYDKIKERHFVYYNEVIKPALVGLTGPWISGGIEFNWPQHHRPSTFMPIDYTLEECADGSAIVWVSERERMFHQKGMAGFKLSPHRAVIEIQGRLYNPTPIPQTFLWWANPAVAVNDAYQSVFPADVNAVFDHGKRDVSTYPIATGIYYKMDYSAGVDISRYKNIPVPTSYMAVQSRYDFVGGYENDTEAGLLHVANHHLSPGKKQWTWGTGDFGQAWERNLTDANGPYIELMTGVYTDNQPDFTWLQPYEEKTFTQYFLPYRELGVVKNASADLLMNIEPEGDEEAILKIFATSLQERLMIEVMSKGEICFEEVTNISPEAIVVRKIRIASFSDIQVSIYSSGGRKLLSWQNEESDDTTIPEAASPALDPEAEQSTEQLYLTGLHLEQYRHATYKPTDYYLEALRRDPGDVRSNNAMGLWLIRHGQFIQAEPYLRKAIETLTKRNPNPYDGEPYYNLGLALKYQGRLDEAYTCFYKACWNGAWQDPGFYSLAQISLIRNNNQEALEEVEKSLIRNQHNHRARHLKAIILRRLGLREQAIEWIEQSLLIDAFNFGCRFEKYLLTSDKEDLASCVDIMRKESHNYIELLIDYLSSGCYEDVLTVIDTAFQQVVSPEILLYYFKAQALHLLGRDSESIDVIHLAEQQTPAYCFPNQLEAISTLQTAITKAGYTPKALYLLGNLWYDKRQYKEAIACWEESMSQDNTFPTVIRNLALAYFNKLKQSQKAVTLLEQAFALDVTDARVLMELDQLYKCLNYSHEERFEFLNKHKQTVWERDDLYLEYVTLLNQLGRHEEAMGLIDNRQFHPWEGGEGKVPAQYQIARVSIAKKKIVEQKYAEALALIEACYVYPPNLGEGKLPTIQENEIDYYRGCVLEAIGNTEGARQAFTKGAKGDTEPAIAMYYNDQKPEKIYYQGLCLLKLDQSTEAKQCFNKLITYGEQHLDDVFKMDYFAVSLPDLQIWEYDMNKKNRVLCYFLIALGYQGLGNQEKATEYFNKCKDLDNNIQWI